MYFSRLAYIAFVLLMLPLTLSAQQEVDSTTTACRNGRWIVGLAGTITSSFVRSDTSTASDYSIEYSLLLSGARMVADRWAIGGFLKGQRATPSGIAQRETESFLIGPEVTWYVSTAETGSTFFRGGVGYTRYRDEFKLVRSGVEIQEITSGQGVGIQGSIGYAVAIADRISFEIGLQSSLNWIWAEKRVGAQMITTDENLTFGSVAFLFGFKALL